MIGAAKSCTAAEAVYLPISSFFSMAAGPDK